MTIKQQGGVFGRNPTFNNVEAETLDVSGGGSFGSTVRIDASSPRLLLNKTTNTSILEAGIDTTGAFIKGTYVSGGTADVRFIWAASEKMRVTNNGITFNGDTAAANALDDYEEGLAGGITLSPETSGSFTVNTALDTLAYTKVGRLVSISGMISCTNVSAVGTFVELDGLPFAAADLTETAGRFSGIAQFDGTSGKPSVVGIALEGWTKIRFPIVASTVTGNIYVNINYIAA